MLIISLSCSKKDPCSDRLGPDSITIQLVDENGNLLLGTKYPTDSVKFIINTQVSVFRPYNGSITYLYYPGDVTINFTYYLYLSYKDTDTLYFTHYKYETKCGSVYECNGLQYNSMNISSDPNISSYFKIIKE